MLFSKVKPSVTLMDMTGKVAFVTGSSHGIGYSTVKHLALRGATVYLGARNEKKALEAVKSLEEEIAASHAKALQEDSKSSDDSVPSPGKVLYHHCDVGTPAEARESAEIFMTRETRLDVLINNAGVLADKAVVDDIIKVNHFGAMQFSLALLPLLIKTAKTTPDVRIVNVSSNAHGLRQANNPNIRFRNWEDYNCRYTSDLLSTFSVYCVSKLANLLAFKALQRRLIESAESDGIPPSNIITCIAVDPGSVNTFSHRLPLQKVLDPILHLHFVTPDTGALNSAFAAASVEVAKDREKYRGSYLCPVGKFTRVSDIAANEALQDELWESSKKILEDWPSDSKSDSQ